MQSQIVEGRHVVELRPAGLARWIEAGFLTFWLAGWAVGEAFGLFMLGTLGAAALKLPIEGLPKTPQGAGALGLLAFILVWVSFWTLGGVAAASQVLKSLWGADRIEWDASGVRVTSRTGPFRRTRFYPRDEVRVVTLRRNGVVIETARGVANLTSFGSRQDLTELSAAIQQSLGLSGRPPAPAELPKGWEAAVDLEGVPVLRKSPAHRRRQAGFVTAIFVALSLAVSMLVAGGESGSQTPPWVAITVLGLLAAGVGAGAAWLWFGGEAVRLKPSHADVLRWFGSRRWLREYASASIQLEHSVDGDGDDWYKLVLRGSSGAKTLAHRLRDPGELEPLGRWVAAKLGRDLEMGSGMRGGS